MTDAAPQDPARLLALAATLEGRELWEEAARLYGLVLDLEPANLTAVTRSLTIAHRLADADATARTLLRVAAALRGVPQIHRIVGAGLRQIGRPAEAAEQYRQALAAGAEPDLHDELVAMTLPGPTAEKHLQWSHILLRPTLAIETGAPADAPQPVLPPPARLHRLPDARDLDARCGGAPVDLAWIGGARPLDALIDDVIALEARSGPGAALLFGGSLPVAIAATAPSAAYWVGDGWRLAVALEQARPDLVLTTIPAAPAGLTVVRRLDPAAAGRPDLRGRLMAAGAAADPAATAARLRACLDTRPNDVGETARALGLRP